MIIMDMFPLEEESFTKYYNKMKEEKKYLETEKRAWGQYMVLLDTPMCKVKAIQVEPGHRLSYQYHTKRAENWTIVNGKATITLDDEKIFREKGESVRIPLGARHRIANESEEKLMFIEVQTGESFDEEDIVRLEDDYGREVDK